MKLIEYKVELTFIRPVLGSAPFNEEIKSNYILKKLTTGRTGMSADIAMERLDEEADGMRNVSAEKVKQIEERGMTVFYRDRDGNICLSDHQIRGFIKDAFAFVGRRDGLMKKGKNKDEDFSSDSPFRKWISDRIMIRERFIPFVNPKVELYERPLRVMTMSGPRNSLATSEIIEEPGKISFTMVVGEDVKIEVLHSIFERGTFKGISQWSNSQWGTFTYEFKFMKCL